MILGSLNKNQKKQPKRWCQFFCLWHLVFLGKDLSYSEGTVGLELEAEPIEPWKLRQPMVSDSFDREVGSHGWWTQKASKKETRGWYIYIYLSIKTMDLDLTMFVFIEIWCDWWIHVDVPVEVWFHMRYLAKNLRKTRRSRCNDFWKAGAKTTAATWMEVFEGDQLLVDRFKH